MREIAGAIAAYRCVDYERIGPQGVRRRFEGCGEAHRGLVPFQFDALARYASAEYPLVLVTERNLFAYRGASLTEQVKGMSRIKAEDVLHLSAADARRLNVAEGSLVKTTSPYGSAESIVSVGNGMPEGLAFTSINISSGSPLLPGGVPNLKALPIRVERATFQRA
jgi:predicted molibdopterin-dependent oxidoreductase YjgC